MTIFALVTVPEAGAAPAPGAVQATPDRSDKDVDVRDTARTSPRVLGAQATRSASRAGSVAQARAELGNQALLDFDELTGTPRVLARTDGFLTGPSPRSPREIVLNYLRQHEGLVGLGADDTAKLNLRKDYVDVEGVHHLSFTQAVGGVPLFGNGLKAHVAKDGRLIQLDGSPVRGLPASLGAATLAAPGPDSKQVAFLTADGVRLAWHTLAKPGIDKMFQQVTDAQTGALLYRKNLVSHANDADGAKGLAWEASPGPQKPVNLTQRGWLPADAKTLDGNVAHVAADINGDLKVQPSEEVLPGKDGTYRYKFTDFTAVVGPPCSESRPCSWDPKTPGSWAKNREQNAVQALAYVGSFHDHLASFPIGFTRAAGNFEKVDGDAVQVHTLLGAKEPGFYNNAFMGTPPDGRPPTMGMFLFHNPRTPRTRSSRRTPRTTPASSTTSTATACPTGSSSTRRATPPSTPCSPARWVRPGATGTPSTTSSAGTRSRTLRHLVKFSPAITSATASLSRAPSRWTARSGQARRSVPAPPERAPAATPTGISAGSSASPRSTPTVRSGRARCGTSARHSVCS